MKPAIDLQNWEQLLQQRDESGFPMIFNICESFSQTLSHGLDAIQTGLKVGNPDAVIQDLEPVKAKCAYLGATHLLMLCEELEGVAKAGSLKTAGDSVFFQLKDAFAAASAEIQRLLHAGTAKKGRTQEMNRAQLLRAQDQKVETIRAVLIVDDNPAILSLLSRTASEVYKNATIETVDTFQKAIETIQEVAEAEDVSERFDLVITELSLGGENKGIDLWKATRAQLPAAHFLFISEVPLLEFVDQLGSDLAEPPAYLPKPFRPDQCRKVLKWLAATQEKAAA